MGNRLSKIYTRTGDKGTTGLADGSRVAKDDLHVEVFGTLDEVNSAIGFVLSHEVNEKIFETLTQVQHDLFDLGSEFCLPDYQAIKQEHISYLEQALDELNEQLTPLKEFILPGGHNAASHCHVARTICRRAERRMVSLMKEENINPFALQYINRLSDLLFVIARTINKENNIKEPMWNHERKK